MCSYLPGQSGHPFLGQIDLIVGSRRFLHLTSPCSTNCMSCTLSRCEQRSQWDHSPNCRFRAISKREGRRWVTIAATGSLHAHVPVRQRSHSYAAKNRPTSPQLRTGDRDQLPNSHDCVSIATVSLQCDIATAVRNGPRSRFISLLSFTDMPGTGRGAAGCRCYAPSPHPNEGHLNKPIKHAP